MNDLLQLKGRFEKRKNTHTPGPASLPAGGEVRAEHLQELADQLEEIRAFWQVHREIEGALVSVHYCRIVPRSSRMKLLLSDGHRSPDDSVRGARFEQDELPDGRIRYRHVFTHYVPLETLSRSAKLLRSAGQILSEHLQGRVDSGMVSQIGKRAADYSFTEMARTTFLKVIVDACQVREFTIDVPQNRDIEESMVTIYRTGVETRQLMSRFGIRIFDDRILDGVTLRLREDEVRILLERAPYLVAMGVRNFQEIAVESPEPEEEEEDKLIPDPSDEPVIGVFDTQFDERVYFHKWVDYRNMLPQDIPLTGQDFRHGTAVDSILVDGPRGNPQLDDECGHFRVRHFGVATHGGMNSFSVLRTIREVVAANTDVKVWNISLGSRQEVSPNFVSAEAAELDRIQNEYDVVFVVAGTNLPRDAGKSDMRMGSPADSINSLVVNSVDFAGNSVSYTRTGPVLSFYNKPDLSYYGGDGKSRAGNIVVCTGNMAASYVSGTSFAAPWIARKMAYLIEVMGLSREVAKALLVDSAAGWKRQDDFSHRVGYGVVPIRISEILRSPGEEIRFVMSGVTQEDETYTYQIPVPQVQGKHPYFARATLVYFPPCDRNQGVDYTTTEMELHFGRVSVDPKTGRPKIHSLDNNQQGDEGQHVIVVEDARRLYRKWDNIRHLSEEIRPRSRPRKAYGSGMWGIQIRTGESFPGGEHRPLAFGLVITLREMRGVNRIAEFVQMCQARGWIVQTLSMENQLKIYAQAQETVHWE